MCVYMVYVVLFLSWLLIRNTHKARYKVGIHKYFVCLNLIEIKSS